MLLRPALQILIKLRKFSQATAKALAAAEAQAAPSYAGAATGSKRWVALRRAVNSAKPPSVAHEGWLEPRAAKLMRKAKSVLAGRGGGGP